MKAKNVAVEGDTVLGRIQHRHLHPEVARVLQSTTHQHHPCLWFTHVNVVIVVIVVNGAAPSILAPCPSSCPFSFHSSFPSPLPTPLPSSWAQFWTQFWVAFRFHGLQRRNVHGSGGHQPAVSLLFVLFCVAVFLIPLLSAAREPHAVVVHYPHRRRGAGGA